MSVSTPVSTHVSTTASPLAPESAPATRPSTPTGAAPEKYHTAAGCLTLSLVVTALMGVFVLFVVLVGDFQA